MNKFSIIIVVSTIFALTSCNAGNNGYTISGTIEGAADGEVAYLQNRVNRQFEQLDSAVIKNEQFTFKGVQDSAVARYLSFAIDGKQTNTSFFLENGNIGVKGTDGRNISITGTPANDAYQSFNDNVAFIENRQMAIYQSMSDSTFTDEQIAEKSREMDALENEMIATVKSGIEKNITNVVGVQLLSSYSYYYTEYPELASLLAKVPENFQENSTIVAMSKYAQTLRTTEVGQKFVDFEMETPDGKPIKLSDYAGKGKIVLVDFWASWCGPCRVEMPTLIDTYKKYRNKGFEIVGVSLDRNSEAWKSGIEQLGITWPQMSDLKYWDCEGGRLYGVRSIPHTVLIDKDGIIIARGLRGEGLQNKLAEIL
ncbi:Thiol-disulfide oxidoreductase ResA [termite gut metagenome]|uniref:Thiol-disulfide oxidoreductase ResA n=1 Tax=termite gut metagenome TaxID=433724 RepID=A0A5J4RFJ2_9ZZZZ